MGVLEWFIVMLVAGIVLVMLVATSRGRRSVVWCPTALSCFALSGGR